MGVPSQIMGNSVNGFSPENKGSKSWLEKSASDVAEDEVTVDKDVLPSWSGGKSRKMRDGNPAIPD